MVQSNATQANEPVLDRARVRVCAESVGASERCLEASVQYAKERIQFGKPLAHQQAIRRHVVEPLPVQAVDEAFVHLALRLGELLDPLPAGQHAALGNDLTDEEEADQTHHQGDGEAGAARGGGDSQRSRCTDRTGASPARRGTGG